MAVAMQNPTDANPIIDKIVRTLHSHLKSECGLVATEIVKAGSLGQGTAVPGEFDLDLIVYSADLNPDVVASGSLGGLLDKIDRLLRNHLRGSYKKRGLTDHAVRFSYDKLEVDLLPSPYWRSPADYHVYLKGLKRRNPEELRMFSCTSAKWLKEFFQDQPNDVRRYIQKAKKWRNTMWPVKKNGAGRPKSILIGLLIVEAYDQISDDNPDPASITEMLKLLVKNHNRLHIHWTHTGQAKYSEDYTSYFPSKPYIIDPANPFNNVYKSGISYYEANSPEGTYEMGDGNWTEFVKKIDSLDLSK